MKGLYNENYKISPEEIKEDINENIYHVHGLEDIIVKMSVYYPKHLRLLRITSQTYNTPI